MQIYLVGGAVRDKLLNEPVNDRDWVVVGGTPEYFISKGHETVGADFPVFLHPETKEEFALARKERKVGDGYNGFTCDYDPSITLEEDLFRRDLTINALAQNDDGKIIDFFNGLEDLKNKTLRHVSDHFKEDPLRVLRIARFMARYKNIGFKIADETKELMKEMVLKGELNHLTKERIVLETEKAFKEETPSEYFYVLRECGALKVVFPDVDRLFGVPQTKEHHPEIDTGIHVMMVLEQAKKLSNTNIDIMWAALTHDLGKGVTPEHILPRHLGHEKAGVPIVKQFCEDLKLSSYVKHLSMLNSEFHLHTHRAFEMNADKILGVLEAFDFFRRPNIFNDFLIACEADARGRTGFENREYPQVDFLKHLTKYVDEFEKESITQKIKDNCKDKALLGKEIKDTIRAKRLEKIKFAKSIYGDELDKTLGQFSFITDLSTPENQSKLVNKIKYFTINNDYKDLIFNYYKLDKKTITLIENIQNDFDKLNPREIGAMLGDIRETSTVLFKMKLDIIKDQIKKAEKVKKSRKP